MREAVGKAQVAMTFVVLQEAVDVTVAQGPVHIAQRRHAVFSQAVRMTEIYKGTCSGFYFFYWGEGGG